MFSVGAEKASNKLLIKGNFIHSLSVDEPVIILQDHAVAVIDGKIDFFGSRDDLFYYSKEHDTDEFDLVQLNADQFVIPGFVDCHTHASQYPYAGFNMDKPLLEWLDQYTFPLEDKFSNSNFALLVYDAFVRKTLLCGTTTAVYFATIHLPASLQLCEIAEEHGQRAFVGKISMNRLCPEYYKETTSGAISRCEEFIQAVKNAKLELVNPIVTPRFGVNCDRDLLKGLADLAIKHDVHIQTILAHGIYLSDTEIDIIKEKGSSIAHCPNSNISLRSGLCDARRLLKAGVKMGLGTDISGGSHPSMLDSIRTTVQTSKILSFSRPEDYATITWKEAFYLATLGGAEALKLDSLIGNFKCGKLFDALVVDVRKNNLTFNFIDEQIEKKLQKFLYLGDDRNIVRIYVNGKQRLNFEGLIC